MNCKICNNASEEIFNEKIMNKYFIQYYKCHNCGFIFTEEPFWLDEAYKNPINFSDTGLLDRNILLAKMTAMIIYSSFNRKEKFLDYAGGYGIFTRLMRDMGFDFKWFDPYCENILAKSFEYDNSIDTNIELITSFEVFEHLVNPLEELNKMLNISRNIIFSTEFLPKEIPDKDWWYYAFEHGQHISFYSSKTFQYISKKMNLNFYDFYHLKILTEKKLNKFLIKSLIKFSKFDWFFILKKLNGSKTWSDSRSLIKINNKIENNNN